LGILLLGLPWLRDMSYAWFFGLGWGVLGYLLYNGEQHA
jgi:hypothetical protein